MSEPNPDDVFIGDELRRRFAAACMSYNELAGRVQTSRQYCVEVFEGIKPLTKTFKDRILVVLRQSETGTLSPTYEQPKRGKPVIGYCGSGANLPEDYVPGVADRPTNAAAGSSEKVEELRRRAELGQELWHPGDNKLAKRIGDD